MPKPQPITRERQSPPSRMTFGDICLSFDFGGKRNPLFCYDFHSIFCHFEGHSVCDAEVVRYQYDVKEKFCTTHNRRRLNFTFKNTDSILELETYTYPETGKFEGFLTYDYARRNTERDEWERLKIKLDGTENLEEFVRLVKENETP